MTSHRVPVGDADLEAHLAEQVAFLHASAAAFDGGFQGEAKRLAVAIRVLVHESRSSKSLLGQLGRLGEMKFFDSALPNQPGNLLTYSGLVITAHVKSGAEYVPILDDHQIGPGEWIPFDRWWDLPVFVDNAKRHVSRKDLVLALANQDGGAHVDPSLNDAYFALSKENSMGWTITKGSSSHPMGPPHLASVRQVAHELLKTLDRGYSKKGPKRDDVLMWSAQATLVDGIPADIVPGWRGPKIVTPATRVVRLGRNELCFCGSGRKYKRCHGA